MKKSQSKRLYAMAPLAVAAAGCEGRIAGMQSGDSAEPPATQPAPTDKTPIEKPAEDIGPPPVILPFDAQPPEAYLPKIKDLLTGLPITSAELYRVKASPGGLRELFDNGRGAYPPTARRCSSGLRKPFSKHKWIETIFRSSLVSIPPACLGPPVALESKSL